MASVPLSAEGLPVSDEVTWRSEPKYHLLCYQLVEDSSALWPKPLHIYFKLQRLSSGQPSYGLLTCLTLTATVKKSAERRQD